MIATGPIDILRFLAARADEGLDCVLVTLAGIEGSSPRAIGAQMAVCADGRYAGSLSGGCIETAVVAEALDVLAAGAPRLVRFGAGSPYLDIRLPCGGGIDLFFHPRADPDLIAEALAVVAARGMAALALSQRGIDRSDALHSGWADDAFHIAYAPALRIVALGQGEDLTALATLAATFGAEVALFTPDDRERARLAERGLDAHPLPIRTAPPAIAGDAWTAFVFLFHDRDWEEALLAPMLAHASFYFGAVGSMRTHRRRLAALAATPAGAQAAARLRGPVGLIAATRHPATLAVSILAEIVAEYDRIVAPGDVAAVVPCPA
ncbi:MAG: XdhC family protein [Sphingopyxis sp.]